MSTIKKLIDQQYGNCKWRSYDDIIKRLRCSNKEHYTQILPSDNDEFVLDTPIFTCKFAQKHGNENFVAIANEDGKLAIIDVENDNNRYGIRAHNNAVFDLAWMFNNMKIATASGDHTARLFDVTNCDIRETKMFLGHNRSVKTITFKQDDPNIFATGGRDGNIVIWDARSDSVNNIIDKSDRTIYSSHNTTSQLKHYYSPKRRNSTTNNPVNGTKSVTGLVFQDDNTLISCGAGDGFIKLWDLRKNYIIYKHQPIPKCKITYCGNTSKNGFSNILLDQNRIILYANCLDNTIYSYNLNTCDPEPIMKYKGHQNNTFYIKSCLSHDGNYLISGSSDENAYIWNIKDSKPFLKLIGHNAEVTCVAWCQKDNVIITCSDDMTHKIWKIGDEDLPENWECLGKGQAEILPLTPIENKLKRHHLTYDNNNDEIISIKKLMMACQRCEKFKATKENKCESCLNLKRKFNEETQPASCSSEDDETKFRIEEELSQLPNFVVNGSAPHLIYSPPKKKPQDWLTKMRIERKLKRDMLMSDYECPISPKSPRLEAVSKSRCKSPQNSPILRFFKVTTNGGCNKTNTINNLVTNSQLN